MIRDNWWTDEDIMKALRGLSAWIPKNIDEILVKDVTFLDELYFWGAPIKWNKEKKR